MQQPAVFFGSRAERIDDGRGIHEKLQAETDQELQVAVLGGERRDDQSPGQGQRQHGRGQADQGHHDHDAPRAGSHDVAALSVICKKYGVLLCVDNAHGAYLKFLASDSHPIALGADVCADSAHKTLPVLTGGAYLHVSRGAPEIIKREAENALFLFGSTSPSYLILSSLDKANADLDKLVGVRTKQILRALNKVEELPGDGDEPKDILGIDPIGSYAIGAAEDEE